MVSNPKNIQGFEESPQNELTGAPLSGSVSSWADEIAHEAGSSPKVFKKPKSQSRAKAKKSKDGRTARGTSVGVAASAKERAAGGLNPVSGLDVSLEEADEVSNTGVTATVAALSNLIEHGRDDLDEVWRPHRPERPKKSQGGIDFDLVSEFEPKGDQPTAIAELVDGVGAQERDQVLLGVTGSGKTYTIANVIAQTGRPALILAPNKTLAAQLYGEFKAFFPNNAVEYFVSYYDYYQPEAYIARTDTHIEKEATINEQIDRLRHSATRSLLERKDVIIVASVSCIYGIGSVETYSEMTYEIEKGVSYDMTTLIKKFVELQYQRNDIDFRRGTFRVKGDTVEIFPAHLEDRAWRLSFFGEDLEDITEFDPLTMEKTNHFETIKLYANNHYILPQPTLLQAVKKIKIELQERIAEFESQGKLLEAQRIAQRTQFDIEMMIATGMCQGIENYSRYLTGRPPGHPPPTLFEYLPDDALLFIDESHVMIPQVNGMYKGDRSRKINLSEYGFRLPSCRDNRPLKFEEWDEMRPQTVMVSATPGPWELEQTEGVFSEQIVRPTGLIDPPTIIRPVETQVDDILNEIQATVKQGYRVLITTLTKKMAEALTDYITDMGVRANYLHSDIDTLERIDLIRGLRAGEYDVLIGINLLREGLDIPECGLVGILDADKEGFLRSKTALIQTIGRAARNVDGRVILYADKMTGSIKGALEETDRRREKQRAHNEAHGITPQSIKKSISKNLEKDYGVLAEEQQKIDFDQFKNEKELQKHLKQLQKAMNAAASNLEFEEAARIRDEIKLFEQIALSK